MNKLIYLWFAVKTAFCSCHSDHKMNGFERIKSHYKIIKTGVLPDVANESSGLVKGNNPNSFWTNNDSGGKPELYKIDSTGKLLSVKKLITLKIQTGKILQVMKTALFTLVILGTTAIPDVI